MAISSKNGSTLQLKKRFQLRRKAKVSTVESVQPKVDRRMAELSGSAPWRHQGHRNGGTAWAAREEGLCCGYL